MDIVTKNESDPTLFFDIDERLKFVQSKFEAGGVNYRCPAHDDQKASLSVRAYQLKDHDGNVAHEVVGLTCFAGCSEPDVLEAAGLTLSDLWGVPVWDYHDEEGNVLYHHAHKLHYFRYDE